MKNQANEKDFIAHKTFYDDDIFLSGEIYFLNTKDLKLNCTIDYPWMDKG